MSAALSKALASVNGLLDADDPKVVLRAVAELSKLLAVCGRNGWAEEAAPPALAVSATPPVPAAPKPERPPAPRPTAAFNADPLNPPAIHDPPLSARSAPLDGPRLTSFLGSPGVPRKPPGRTNSA
jgi:hypothetical protein